MPLWLNPVGSPVLSSIPMYSSLPPIAPIGKPPPNALPNIVTSGSIPARPCAPPGPDLKLTTSSITIGIPSSDVMSRMKRVKSSDTSHELGLAS